MRLCRNERALGIFTFLLKAANDAGKLFEGRISLLFFPPTHLRAKRANGGGFAVFRVAKAAKGGWLIRFKNIFSKDEKTMRFRGKGNTLFYEGK